MKLLNMSKSQVSHVRKKRPDALTNPVASLTLGPEIRPLGHIIEQNYPPKECQIRMKRIQWEVFEEITDDLKYDLFRGPKWFGYGASVADIQLPSKSNSNWHVNQNWCKTSGIYTCNGYVKQYVCETHENLYRKWTKTGMLTYFEKLVDEY